ncbi:MAG: hypothetical protein J7L47_00170, partial [Candidatus Odinarchaeota archaeon]|nr:hypothetical protein [Candidatus Odinarchaeota archaeon]
MKNTKEASGTSQSLKNCYRIIDILVDEFPQRYHKSYQRLKDLVSKCNSDFLKKFVTEIVFQYPYSALTFQRSMMADFEDFLNALDDEYYKKISKFMFGKILLFLGEIERSFKYLLSFARDVKTTDNDFFKSLVGYILNLADIILSCEKYSLLYDKYIDIIEDIVSDKALNTLDIKALTQKNLQKKYNFLLKNLAQVSFIDFIFQVINFPNIAEGDFRSITGLEEAVTPYQAITKLEEAYKELLKNNPKLKLLILEAKLFFIWKDNKKEANQLFNDLLDTMEEDYVKYFAPELFTIWKYRETINELDEKTFIDLINTRIIDVLK